jgi:hypothetical protein
MSARAILLDFKMGCRTREIQTPTAPSGQGFDLALRFGDMSADCRNFPANKNFQQLVFLPMRAQTKPGRMPVRADGDQTELAELGMLSPD